ncbi:MAG TPA: hypothetical protein VGL66_07465 [Caulobacteraceae bacterium]|jgi:hypothetical protein
MRGAANSRVWLGSILAVLLCAGTGETAFAQSAIIRLGVDPASEQGQSARLHAALDRAFGAGKWRVTSGYRSEALENQLRAMGAGTVPVGAISHHSMGTPDAPGAYDVVVEGMDQSVAAQVLRNTDPGFSRILFEGAHGPEGAHLHIEMGARSAAGSTAPKLLSDTAHMDFCNSIYERVVDGHRNSKLKGC